MVVITSLMYFFTQSGSMKFYSSSYILMLIFILTKILALLPMEENMKIFSFYSLDLLSISLILLSVFLSVLMIFASFTFKALDINYSVYSYLIMTLALVLVITFMSNNLLMFYLFFEVSLIPTLMIIMGWGGQPERLQAGVYFMLYTLAASLPLLMLLLSLYHWIGSLEFLATSVTYSNGFLCGKGTLSTFLSVFLILAFLVKMPMFLTHLWLPKAHVEAPVAGSMILAGVLLKLGGYGICRMMMMFEGILSWLSSYIIGLSLVGMTVVGMICCRLNDMKALVAYSSVAHMGLVLGGIMSFYMWGMNGGLVMMLGHGLVSSGLFCSVNLFYERMGSRSLFLNKGLIIMTPIFCMLVFILCCFNISAPPSINLMSEILLMVSVLSYDLIMMLMFPLGSFLGAVFTFYMFSYSQHGKGYSILWGSTEGLYMEFHCLVLHILPVVGLILNPTSVMLYL